MASKPASRSWTDVQMTIAAVSMSAMLVLWNLFAGPDRAKAEQKAKEEAQQAPPDAVVTEIPALVLAPTPITKIYFSDLPQPQPPTISIPSGKNKKNRDNGGGGGGGGGTTGTS